MSKKSAKQPSKNAVVPTPQAPPSALSAKSRQQLEDMHARFGVQETALHMWNDVFTSADRVRLGDEFNEARNEYGGTIGMAMAAWSCSRVEAVVRLCEAFQSYDPITLKRLRRESGLQEPGRQQIPPDKPCWDGHGQLTFKGKIIRKTRGRKIASHVSAILSAFEEQNWPERIDDPLPGQPDGQRLREAIRNLNRGLKLILFLADGSGEGIRWQCR
jgi:hypothetical protein